MMAMNSRSLLSRLQLPMYDRTHLATLPKDTEQKTRTNTSARARGDSKAALALHGRSHVPRTQAKHLSEYHACWLGTVIDIIILSV